MDGVEKLNRIDLVHAIFEARRSGDYELMLLGFAPDARYRLAGRPKEVPFGGDHHGHEGIRRLYQNVESNLVLDDLDVGDVVMSEDRAVTRITYLTTNRKTGKSYEMQAAVLMVFGEDGRVCSYTEMYDTAKLSRRVRGD
jgi:ketosteroid isomerase-like protein